MRPLLALLVVASLSLAACSAEAPSSAQPAAGDAGAASDSGTPTGSETTYGAPVGDAPLVALADLVGAPDEYVGKAVRVQGLVTGVCAKRGCWIDVGAEEGPEQVTFKVEDGVMVFPMSAKGKRAEVEGTVKKFVLPVEKARDYLAAQAKESGEPFDPGSVTEPLTIVRLAGRGAVIRER